MNWLLHPNLVLLGLVELTCSATLLRTLRVRGRAAWDVRLVLLPVMIAGGVLYWLLPSAAGYATTALWALVVLGPTLLGRAAQRAAQGRDYHRAARLARYVARFQPIGNWGHLAEYYDALEHLRRGRREQGLAALRALTQGSSPFAAVARGELLANAGEFEKLIAEFEAEPDGVQGAEPTAPSLGRSDPKRLATELSLLSYYVRALGEVAGPVRLLEAVDRAGARLETRAAAGIVPTVLLFVFAFCGRKDRVGELFHGPLRHMDAALQELWLGTAELAAGDQETGRARLTVLAARGGDPLARRAAQRLEHPPPLAAARLGASAREILARLEREWDGRQRYAFGVSAGERPVVTWAIVATLLGVYGLEVVCGGATNLKTLLALGALDSSLVSAEPWRVLTAQLLHFGPVHLGMNLLGLAVLGGFVERRLGRVRYLLVYVASGTLALGSFVVLAWLGVTAQEILIGASGNIMGLAGATAAIVAHGWWREGSRAARRHLMVMAAIVVGQAVADLTIVGTSFAAHALGAAFGFILVAPMVGMALGRAALVGLSAIALSVAGEHFASRKLRRREACRRGDLAVCDESCHDGAAAACGELAARYDDGKGVAVDRARARRYYRLACNGGERFACNNLGVLLDRGLGGSRDHDRAAGWYRTACKRQDPAGCRNLARSVADGYGQAGDAALARRAVTRLCKAGDAKACDLARELTAQSLIP